MGSSSAGKREAECVLCTAASTIAVVVVVVVVMVVVSGGGGRCGIKIIQVM